MTTSGKRCGGCARDLPRASFWASARRADGLQTQCRECTRAAQASWALRNPEAALERKLAKYGLTRAGWDALVEDCGGRCKICGKVDLERSRLCIDHDHACCPGDSSCGACVRGLLCVRCNAGLGNFRDNTDLLAAAMDYLTATRRTT